MIWMEPTIDVFGIHYRCIGYPSFMYWVSIIDVMCIIYCYIGKT
jgi:hypothetical protein